MGGLAFLFGGPGLAEPGMGRDLYNKNPLVRESVDRADKVMNELGGVRPTKACFAGGPELIRRPSVAGPAVLALAHGTVRALKARRVYPQSAAAFGWGELVALGALGGLDFDAALKLLYERGLAAEEAWNASPWSALAIQGLPGEALDERLKSLPEPPFWAARLGADHGVLCGPEAVLKQLHGALEKAGRTVKVTPVEPGWQWPHPRLEGAKQACIAGLAVLTFEHLPTPIQGAAEAEALRQARDWPAYLEQWGNQPLDWPAACRRLKRLGMDTALEIGSSTVLGAALHKLDTDVRVLGTEDNAAFAQAVKLSN